MAAGDWTAGPEGEEGLVAAARKGDRRAAESLLRRHELVAFRVCRSLLPPGEDVEAAAQDVLVRVLRGLPQFAGRGSVAGWVASIAVNLCRDRLRRRRLVPFVSLDGGKGPEAADPMAVLPAGEPDPERVAMARQAVDRVRIEVAALPPRQRETFTLRFFAGLGLEEIAAALAVDVGTVKTHLHRAVRRVRAAAREALP